MPGYPSDTLRVVWGGKIASDIWRTGVDLDITYNDFGPSGAELNTACSSIILPLLNTWWTTHKAFNTTAVDFSYLSAYFYPAGASTSFSQGQAAVSPVTGTGSGSLLPLRTAVAISKRTDLAGRSHRGRFYLPATAGLTIGADGQFTSANAASMCNAMGTLVQGFNNATWAPGGITTAKAVVSSMNHVGAPNPITQLRCDTLPDTQRRRTNKDTANAVQTANIT